MANLETGKRRRELDRGERRQSNDNTAKRERIHQNQRLSSSLDVVDRQTPVRCRSVGNDSTFESLDITVASSGQDNNVTFKNCDNLGNRAPRLVKPFSPEKDNFKLLLNTGQAEKFNGADIQES